jgi:hypothetical protein
MAASTGSTESYFVRGRDGVTSAAGQTAAGRDVNTGDVDNDEEKLEVTIVDHPPHYHTFDPDTCHGDVGGTATHHDFLSGAVQSTSREVDGAMANVTLDHDITVTFTPQNKASTADRIEFTPPHMKLFFYERIA